MLFPLVFLSRVREAVLRKSVSLRQKICLSRVCVCVCVCLHLCFCLYASFFLASSRSASHSLTHVLVTDATNRVSKSLRLPGASHVHRWLRLAQNCKAYRRVAGAETRCCAKVAKRASLVFATSADSQSEAAVEYTLQTNQPWEFICGTAAVHALAFERQWHQTCCAVLEVFLAPLLELSAFFPKKTATPAPATFHAPARLETVFVATLSQ